MGDRTTTVLVRVEVAREPAAHRRGEPTAPAARDDPPGRESGEGDR